MLKLYVSVPVVRFTVVVAPVGTQLPVASWWANTSSVTVSPVVAPVTVRIPVNVLPTHADVMLMIVVVAALVVEVVEVDAVAGVKMLLPLLAALPVAALLDAANCMLPFDTAGAATVPRPIRANPAVVSVAPAMRVATTLLICFPNVR